ncbi:MAG: hypothetical protein WCP03_01670 [Candidatus Saccharibacteria bacterium]
MIKTGAIKVTETNDILNSLSITSLPINKKDTIAGSKTELAILSQLIDDPKEW